MKLSNKGKKKGFTLIELMVVVAIIAALALLALPRLAGGSDKAKLKAFEGNYRTLASDVTTAMAQDYSGTGDDTLAKALEAVTAKGSKINGPGNAAYAVAADGVITATYKLPKSLDDSEAEYKLVYNPKTGETTATNPPKEASFK